MPAPPTGERRKLCVRGNVHRLRRELGEEYERRARQIAVVTTALGGGHALLLR